MKKQIIVIDFDHVLFNTTIFVRALRERFASDFGISEEEFMKNREKIKQCCLVVDMDNFVAVLKGDRTAMHQVLHEVIENQASECIFSDVAGFIARHKDNFDIAISTHGDKELQGEKIKHSHLDKSVKKLISTRDKKDVIGGLLRKYAKVYFFDDKSSNIDEVKTAWPQVVTYFVRRPEDKPYGDIPSKCECADHTIAELGSINLN